MEVPSINFDNHVVVMSSIKQNKTKGQILNLIRFYIVDANKQS